MRLRRLNELPQWIDLVIATLAAIVAWRLSTVDSGWRTELTGGILSDSGWPDYLGTLASTASALLGFGATAIAVLLVLSPGRRGRQVFLTAGRGLNSVIGGTLGAVAVCALVLALASGLHPSQAPVPFGVALSAVVAFSSLRLLRLWVLIRQLLDVFVLDAVEEAGGGGPRV